MSYKFYIRLDVPQVFLFSIWCPASFTLAFFVLMSHKFFFFRLDVPQVLLFSPFIPHKFHFFLPDVPQVLLFSSWCPTSFFFLPDVPQVLLFSPFIPHKFYFFSTWCPTSFTFFLSDVPQDLHFVDLMTHKFYFSRSWYDRVVSSSTPSRTNDPVIAKPWVSNLMSTETWEIYTRYFLLQVMRRVFFSLYARQWTSARQVCFFACCLILPVRNTTNSRLFFSSNIIPYQA